MQFALTFPDHVEKLAVVDIAPKAYPPWHAEIFKGLLGLKLSSIATRTDADADLAASVPDPAVRGFLLKNLARDTEGRFYWRFNLQALSDSYSELNANIPVTGQFTGPVLFVAGEQSDYLASSDLREIQRLFFPAATLQSVPGAGHWVHSEQPEAFLKIISDFFAEKS